MVLGLHRLVAPPPLVTLPQRRVAWMINAQTAAACCRMSFANSNAARMHHMSITLRTIWPKGVELHGHPA